MQYQEVITKLPVTDNVLQYAVSLVAKTRPDSDKATDVVKQYIEWGAGPRASQFMLMGSKCHAAINGKYAPDIEDVKSVAKPILRHRLVKNYKAEAEGVSSEPGDLDGLTSSAENEPVPESEGAIAEATPEG